MWPRKDLGSDSSTASLSSRTGRGGSAGGAAVRNPPVRESRCSFPPWVRRSPAGGQGNPVQHSCLQSPTDRGAWGARKSQVTQVSEIPSAQLSAAVSSPAAPATTPPEEGSVACSRPLTSQCFSTSIRSYKRISLNTTPFLRSLFSLCQSPTKGRRVRAITTEGGNAEVGTRVFTCKRSFS